MAGADEAPGGRGGRGSRLRSELRRPCCARSSRWRARSSAPRPPRSCSTTKTTDELVFEAVVGEGEETLLGTRIPAGTGIAGWVLASQEPLVIEDVESRSRGSPATSPSGCGYVPKGLMAAPLLQGRGGDRGALGARPSARCALHRRRDGPARPVREPGCDRARAPAQVHAARRRPSRAPRRPAGELAAVGSIANEERRAAALDLVAALAELLRQDPERRRSGSVAVSRTDLPALASCYVRG